MIDPREMVKFAPSRVLTEELFLQSSAETTAFLRFTKIGSRTIPKTILNIGKSSPVLRTVYMGQRTKPNGK